MVLIFGIYERLIDILGDLVRTALSLVRLDFGKARQIATTLPVGFVSGLAAGILLATILGASLIPTLLESYPSQSRGLFFGLILGSLAIPWLRIRKRTVGNAVLVVLAAVLAYGLVGLPPASEAEPALLFVFLAAGVAVCAMILPGVSGAYLLLVMGMYRPILDAIAAGDAAVIVVFVLGAGIGLGSFALFLKWLLHRAHDATMAVLVGLMAGSLRALWPWQLEDRSLVAPDPDTLVLVIVLFAGGFLLSVAMTVWEIGQQKRRDFVTR